MEGTEWTGQNGGWDFDDQSGRAPGNKPGPFSAARAEWIGMKVCVTVMIEDGRIVILETSIPHDHS